MSTFVVHCYLTAIDKDGEVELHRTVELPFVPFIGLTINFQDLETEEGTNFEVNHLEWSVQGRTFWVFGGFHSGDECCCEPGDECCELAGTIDYFTKDGWEIESGPRFGKDRYMKQTWTWPDLA